MGKNNRVNSLLLALSVVAVVAWVAIVEGGLVSSFYISDSVNYMRLAENIKAGNWMNQHGLAGRNGWFAVWPVGYPALLAAFSSVFRIESFWASKVFSVACSVSLLTLFWKCARRQFPWFGKPFPKQYFWSGARGVSLSENIRVALSSPERLASKISIHSAALARKLNPNPRPITPKGGKKYLAIPAKPSAVLWKGMPRDFPGGLRLAYTKTPTGKWLPSLVAAANYLKKDGSISPSLKGSNHGMNDVVYWLVRKTNPKNDLNAIPHLSTLAASASKAIKTAIETLIKAL